MTSTTRPAVTVTLLLDDAALDLLAGLVAERLSTTTTTTTTSAPAFTTSTLSAELGISERAVRAAIHRGDLLAEKRGRRWIIAADAVTAWATPTTTTRRRTHGPRPRTTTGTLTATLARLEREA